MSSIKLVGVTKRFGNVVAVDNVDLEIKPRTIFALLGPSGCGKTTTLRIIAGLVKPDTGKIYIDGADVTNYPPEKRNIGMVFQNYALWPHMTVYDNIAFGLKLKKVPEPEIRRRVKEVLRLVKLEGFEPRYPTQLSGGQQQRVALARALALDPHVLLLDEPLSNLDAKLREELRFELRSLLKELSITAVYVTHDQIEALSIADEVAVMNNGRIVQIGTPSEIYSMPINKFVASFIGISSFIEGVLEEAYEGYGVVKLKSGVRIRGRIPHKHVKLNDVVTVVVRPEHIEIVEKEGVGGYDNVVECRVVKELYLGNMIEYRIECEGYEVRVHRTTGKPLKIGEKVRVRLDPDKIILLQN